MRVSVDRESPYFQPDYYLYDVYLDGEKIQRCVEADEVSGTVWVVDFVRGGDETEHGQHPKEWVPCHSKKHGKVRIVKRSREEFTH